MKNYILTITGKAVTFGDVRPDDINIMDIATGLAREGRFANQGRFFYSVAQHSVLMARLAGKYKFETLMHDASEAYMKDIPAPLKGLIPSYKEIEDQCERAIRKKFGISEERHAQSKKHIKSLDKAISIAEAKVLLPACTELDTWIDSIGVMELDVNIEEWSQEKAFFEFMRAYRELGEWKYRE